MSDENQETEEQSVTNCNRLGNAAAMREALLRCDAIAQMPEIREYLIVKDMRNLIKKALAAPPRNCDKYRTLKEGEDAWNRLTIEDRCRYSFFIDKWLYAEAKGETKC